MSTTLINEIVGSEFKITDEEVELLRSVLKEVRNAVILTHISSDSDAFGSAVALTLLLQYNYNINAWFITEDSLDGDWLRLVGTKSERSMIRQVHSVLEALKEVNPSHIFVVDINHFHRLTHLKEQISDLQRFFDQNVKNIVVIDHHVEAAPEFGDVQIMKPFTSTGELLYTLLEIFDWEYDQRIMNLLLLAILGDLGRLRWLKHGFSLEILNRIVSAGADWSRIYKILGVPMTLKTRRLLVHMINNIQDREYFSYILVPYEDYEKFKGYAFSRVKSFLKEHILSQVLKPAYVVITEKERGKFYFSLFAEAPDLQLHKFAEQFGGGGHPFAAGFRLTGDNQKVEEVLQQFDEFLNSQLER